jgi:hypothetical protein
LLILSPAGVEEWTSAPAGENGQQEVTMKQDNKSNPKDLERDLPSSGSQSDRDVSSSQGSGNIGNKPSSGSSGSQSYGSDPMKKDREIDSGSREKGKDKLGDRGSSGNKGSSSSGSERT